MEQRIFGPGAGESENTRREVEHRVDAGELVEEGDEEGQQDRNAQLPRPEMGRDNALRGRSQNLVRLSLDLGLGGVGLDELEHFQSRLTVSFPSDQPAWTFGNAKAQNRIEEGRKRRDAKHPTPRVLADPLRSAPRRGWK